MGVKMGPIAHPQFQYWGGSAPPIFFCVDILLCHVYKVSTTIIIKMTHNQVSIGLPYSTFPLIAITLCHVSSNPMAVPNCFYKT